MQLYAIRAGDDAVKVGISKNARARFSSIQTDCPLPCALFGVRDGTAQDETRLHRLLRPFHLRGEWFRWCLDVERLLREEGFAPPASGTSRAYTYRPWTEEQKAQHRATLAMRWANPEWAAAVRLKLSIGVQAAAAKRRTEYERAVAAAYARRIRANAATGASLPVAAANSRNALLTHSHLLSRTIGADAP